MGRAGVRRRERLLTPVGVLCGGWACAVAAAALAVAVAVVSRRAQTGRDGLFNDFYDYWAAARILSHGGNPYDPLQVAHVLSLSGVHSTVGTAYSYPLLLAEVARPLGFLPPGLAAAVFTAGSLAALWLGVALLLSPLRSATLGELVGLATASALFAPVLGTLYFGQVNLYVLPLLALAVREVAPEASLALAAAVKLYPATAAFAFVTRGRRGIAALAVTLGATAALSILPNAAAGLWPHAGVLLGPDPFWSNESINGWLSRQFTPGPAVTVAMVAICAALGVGVAALVVARRDRPWAAAFALLLTYGVVAAPKNSLWNFTPLIVAGVWCWSAGRRSAATVAALGTVWALVTAQALLDATESLHGNRPGPGPLSGIALYGGLLLLLLLGRQLWRARPPAEARPGARKAMVA
jgi:hypothetical protein